MLSLLTAMREGRANDPRFHARMRGTGPRYQVIADLFRSTANKLGLTPPPGQARSPFRRPYEQGTLFDDAGGV